MQRGKGRRGEEEPRGSVNLTSAQGRVLMKRIEKYEREQIESCSSVGSKRLRQHLGAR